MTENTSANADAKTAKRTANTYGLPNYEIPKFDLPAMEMPEAFREMAEKGVAQAKDTYEKAKVVADEAADFLKDAYAAAAKSAGDYNFRVIEIARTNTKTAYDFAHDLLGVKSPAEFIELSSAHARAQLEAMTAQTKELTELAQKVASETAVQGWRNGKTKTSSKAT